LIVGFCSGVLIIVLGLTNLLSWAIAATLGPFLIAVTAMILAYLRGIEKSETSKLVSSTGTVEKEQGEIASREQPSRVDIRWKIRYPIFPTPLRIAMNYPNVIIMHFDLKFEIENLTNENLYTKVYAVSRSPAVIFTLDYPVTQWSWKYGIIPHRKVVKLSSDKYVEEKISAKQKGELLFHFIYRPRQASEDWTLKRHILVEYRLSAISEDKQIVIDSYYKRIVIPFKDITQTK